MTSFYLDTVSHQNFIAHFEHLNSALICNLTLSLRKVNDPYPYFFWTKVLDLRCVYKLLLKGFFWSHFDGAMVFIVVMVHTLL